MNPKVALTVCTVAALSGAAQAIFDGGLTVTGSTIAFTGATGGGAALALGGLAVLKVAAVAAIALSQRGRGKRSVEVDADAPFALIAQVEPDQCYRRLICDLATGKMPKSENDVILQLFKDETPVTSPKFEFATAAQVGALTKDVEKCEVRYSCPLAGEQINALLAA